MKLKEEKVYTLAYADDMVLLAEYKEGMKAMMSRLYGRLYEGKKIGSERKEIKTYEIWEGKRRKKIVKWRWEGAEVEEIQISGIHIPKNGKRMQGIG